MITWIASQFLHSCVTFFCALFNFITFDYFKKDVLENWTGTSLEVDQFDYLEYAEEELEEKGRTSTSRQNVKVEVFPLLRLPLVAREHVLCMMTPFELIYLSMTSSRAKRAVTAFSRIKPRFSVALYLLHEPSINIKGHKNKWVYIWRTNPSSTRRSPFFIIAPSKNPRADCLRRYEMIKKLLGCPINQLCVESPSKSLTDWLRSQQSSIKKIRMGFGDHEELKYFFKTINVFGKIDLTVIRNFGLEFPEGVNRSVRNTEVNYYEQFLRLNAAIIIYHNPVLTNRKINRFLRSWMAMESHLDLEVFRIDVSGPGAMETAEEINEIMHLPNKVTADPNSMEKIRRVFPNYTMENGFNIERRDGKVATVCLGRINWIVDFLFNSSLIGYD